MCLVLCNDIVSGVQRLGPILEKSHAKKCETSELARSIPPKCPDGEQDKINTPLLLRIKSPSESPAPTTAYAFMQAMGLVNDHVGGCAARARCEQARKALGVLV